MARSYLLKVPCDSLEQYIDEWYGYAKKLVLFYCQLARDTPPNPYEPHLAPISIHFGGQGTYTVAQRNGSNFIIFAVTQSEGIHPAQLDRYRQEVKVLGIEVIDRNTNMSLLEQLHLLRDES